MKNLRQTTTDHDSLDDLDRLGEQLVALSAITRDQLRIALQEQRQNADLLGTTLVRLGFLSEHALAETLADRAGLLRVDLHDKILDHDLMRLLPCEVARRCRAVPLSYKDLTLKIALADPYDLVAMDEIRRHFSREIVLVPCVATEVDIQNALDHSYGQAASFGSVLHEMESDKASKNDTHTHPIVRLVEALLFDAVRYGASDIHLEPEDGFVRVRLRVDGALRVFASLHRTHWPALSNRLKVMAGMNIADTRSIQDGRFRLTLGGNEIDFRVAIMPTVWGETISVRLLDHRVARRSLHELGFCAATCANLHALAARPHGMTIVTGPTGCGKTTTLYALLRQISTEDVHIATLEEPVEYQVGLMRQTAVNDAQGLTFAAGVRGLLRMDPDILFIGEVRDTDTAHMAFRAAMTGHQVFTTLHCADSLGALPRLMDLGVAPHTLAGHISGIVAQRLLPKLCPACKTSRRATAEESVILRRDPDDPPMIFVSKGCAFCAHTGTKGRTVVAEVLRVTAALDELIAAKTSRATLALQARKDGFQSLQENGIHLVLSGVVALSDLCRAIDISREF